MTSAGACICPDDDGRIAIHVACPIHGIDAPDYGAEALGVREAQSLLDSFKVRSQGGVVFTTGALFEEFVNDILLQAEVKARAKPKGTEPTVWSAGEQLNAIKYAADPAQGFITPLEAQRLTRKLLKLRGMRTLAVPRARARRATPAPRRRTAR